MLELTVIVIGYNECGNICQTRNLPIYEDETDSLMCTIGGVFRQDNMVKTIEVKFDINSQIVASSVEDLGQLKQLLKQKFESLTLNNL